MWMCECNICAACPWWTEHVCSAHKKDYFSSLHACYTTLFSSSYFSAAPHRFIFLSFGRFFLCPFVTCCQLFNISKHMMSNKNFPLSYKYTFDHPFLYNKKQTIVSHMNKQKNEWAMERFTSSYLILYFASKYLLSFKKSSIVHEWVERNVSFFMMVYGDKHLNRCSNTMKTSRFVPSIKCNCITHTWYIYDIIHVE